MNHGIRKDSRSPISSSTLVLFVFLACAAASGAQSAANPLPVDRAAMDTGTQNTGAILQDSDGFLWIGTLLSGLVRFDGYELKAYKPGGSGSLSDASVFAVYEDRDGRIWCTTGKGLNRYDKDTDSFTVYRHDPADPGSLCNDSWQFLSTQSIGMGPDGTLWIGTRAGLEAMDPGTDRFRHFLPGENVRAVLVDREGNIWAGTDGGLARLDRQGALSARFRRDPADPGSLGSDRVTCIREDPSGGIWVGTEDGLYRLDRGAAGFQPFRPDPSDAGSLRAGHLVSMAGDRYGRIWIAYINARQAGLSVLDPGTGRFTHVQSDPADPAALSSKAASGVLEDASGTLWIVNDNGIVDKMDPRKPPFQVLRADPADPDSLPNAAALRIIEDRQGVIWIGTRPTGLTAYDKSTGRFTRHLNDRYYPAILEDSAGRFWLSTTVPGTLHLYDREARRILRSWTNRPGDGGSLAATPQINDIVQDRRDPDVFWLVVWGAGIDRFDAGTETFTHFRHDPADPDSLREGQSYTAVQDDAGFLWIPTQGGGLDRLDPASGKVRHHMMDPAGTAGPLSDSLFSAYRDASGALWFGSTAGLDRLDPATGRFTHYAAADGRSLASPLSIGRDGSGALWLGSATDGLARFDPASGTLKVFTERDGLPGNAFYPWNALRDRDGEMWFGGAKGAVRFRPERVVTNEFIPPVALTALKRGGEPLVTGRAAERVEAVSLDWGGNFFEFEYAALSFTQADRNRYRYMLEGWDKDWFDAGTRRFGRYSGLQPGRYTLRVTASNNDGLWNARGVSVRVTVAPPWWRSWWFYVLAAAAAAGSLATVVATRRSRRREALAAARAVRESEERYRTLFENSPVAVLVSSVEGRLLAQNGNLSRLLGYGDEEAKRIHLTRIYRDPAERARILEQVQKAGRVRDFETTLVSREGRAFPATLTVSPIELGGIPALLTVVQDIGARKAAEAERDRLWRELQQQADRVRRIMDAVPEGVFLLDPEGRVILANPAARQALSVLAGGEPERLIVLGNRTVEDLLDPPPQGSAWHEVETAGPNPRLFEVLARSVDADAGSTGRVLVLREVTLERQMQQRVRQQEKLAAVGQLTAGIAHDFNNLLTAINGFAELGRMQLPKEDGAQEWMEGIQQSGRRAADLVRQLLIFSSRQIVEPRILNLNEVVSSMDKMLRRIIGEDIVLTKSLVPDPWPVRADPTQIEQVIMNLAVNARDAMPRGGRLSVETAHCVLDGASAAAHALRAGEYVLLSMIDSGTGMSGEVKAHLFEPFFTTKEAGRGTGLGLATVFGIVKRAEGGIDVFSEEGHGTVFRIYLPRAGEESPERPPLAAGFGLEAPEGGRTILLVEDSPAVRKLAQRVLRDLRYSVLEAEDGEEALRVAGGHAGPIHLLLTDVVMPGLGGKDLAERLSRDRPELRILFMSGYTDNVIGFHGLPSHGVSFLRKPFLPGDLAQKVRTILN